jgi:hypothetical protein
MEVRLCSLQEEVSWRLRPSNTADPRIAADVRTGTLRQGEFQVVDDITENDYFFEVFVDGELSTFYVDLDSPPELNKYFTVHVLGDLPTFGVGSIEEYRETYLAGNSVPPVPEGEEDRWMQTHEIEVPVAPGVPDSISMPMDAYAQVDDNQPTEFMVESVVGYETNNVETTVRASDADGIVTDFLVDSVEPKYDGFEFLDNTFDRATTIGGTSSQVLRTLADVPVGSYELTLVANRESLNADAYTTVSVEVKEIDFARLYDLVDMYESMDDLSGQVAQDMRVKLKNAEDDYAKDKLEKACKKLEEFAKVAADTKGAGATEQAAKDFELETKRLQENINCG